jgi:hypothetical protein
VTDNRRKDGDDDDDEMENGDTAEEEKDDDDEEEQEEEEAYDRWEDLCEAHHQELPKTAREAYVKVRAHGGRL